METNTNILNYGDIERLAIKYNVPIVDVLLMALNRYGICANLEDKRIRFKLRPILTNEVYYLAICVNTFNSPFTIDDRNQLILDGMGVGQIFDIEKDTCDATYCITGISSSSFSRRSISKHSGALMSSRLIPPNVGAIALTASINLSGSFSFTSISNTSMPA